MTRREELLALAARVEAAQGADHQLDIDIECVLEWPYAPWMGEARMLTASLDAAASLVPAGWRWSLDYTQRPAYQDCGCASMFAPGSGWHPADVAEIYAATPALALTAAALRARAKESGDD